MDGRGLLVFLLLGLSAPILSALREFYFVNQPKTWTEAQSYCRERFTDLATVESADDYSKIREFLVNSGQIFAWIGLYDDVKGWRWSLDNTSLYDRDYQSMFSFSEDNYISSEHCCFLHLGKLHDITCFHPTESVCYDESSNSYLLVTDFKIWQDALTYCRQTYTDLAIIRDQQEFNVLSQLGSNLGIWVGLSRESWQWSDQSEASFIPWFASEPSGGPQACGAAHVNGLYDGNCDAHYTFICSAPQRKVFKVTLKTDGSVNLNDPLVLESLLKQMEEALRGQGVSRSFRLRWREQPHGNVFNKTEL